MVLEWHEYQKHDALDLAALVARRDVTAAELLDVAIERSRQVQPLINALSHIMGDDAHAALRTRPAKGALYGVPFLLKDISTHVTGWPMTSGSLVFRDHVSTFTSDIVDRYVDAGLTLFGRTCTPEFGYAATAESRLYGATHNPWDLSLTAGGSSGGAAAAVAAGIVPVTQGGDAGGSLRIPASWCGLFAIKPTRGRTPSGPHHGSFLGFTTTHVISRSVRDSALLLDLTSGPDLGAPYFAAPPPQSFLSATSSPCPRLRIGVQRESYDGTPVAADCLAAVDDAAQLLRELGHDVCDVRVSFDHAKLRDVYFKIWPSVVLKTLENRTQAEGKPWDESLLETYVARLVHTARDLTASDLIGALENMHAVAREYVAQTDAFDMLLSPVTANIAPPIGRLAPSNPDQRELDEELAGAVAFTQIANVSGQPAMSVPLYWSSRGLPVGVQFTGRYGDEYGLLRLAGQLERARPWFHKTPALATP